MKAKILLSQEFMVEARDGDALAYVMRKYVSRFAKMGGIDGKVGPWEAMPLDIRAIYVEELPDADESRGTMEPGGSRGDDRPREKRAALDERSNPHRVHVGELSLFSDANGRGAAPADEVKPLEIF